ncbi:MAG: ribbon-helix-helix domain-containing protein [Thermoproteota archaeon]
MKKYSLIGEPDICRGGRLKSIVYCCSKECIFFKIALKKLGLSYKDYTHVKKENDKVVNAEKNKKVHLAYSRSLETKDEARDTALKALGWTPTDYYEYKKRILEALLPYISNHEALEERIVKPYSLDILDLDSKKLYKATALGSIDARILSLKHVVEKDDYKEEVELGETDYVGVRVPRQILNEIDKIISRGLIASRSDAIRLGLHVVTRAYRSLLLEQEAEKAKSL